MMVGNWELADCVIVDADKALLLSLTSKLYNGVEEGSAYSPEGLQYSGPEWKSCGCPTSQTGVCWLESPGSSYRGKS